MPVRYAIWAAVSTEIQAAEDKVSLPEQERQCRTAALDRHWTETAGPYIISGESRTRWVNLRDAEAQIPALSAMLNAAQAKQFDLLILYDYNRLRDLLSPVSKTLSHYGVQIYSLAQPVEPLPPDHYSPYASDASSMMQGLSQIISQAQISDLRRKYDTAMPRRVSQRGLPIHIPWGYRKPPGRETDSSAVPVQDLDRCALLIQAKDALLEGKSLSQLADMFIASNFSPPGGGKTWYAQTIKDMLRNPFYAGAVRFGISKTRLDPRTGQRYRDHKVPAAKTIVGLGRHEPLWDESTHQAIIVELSSRGKNYRGRKNNQFTSLLECGQCGAKLWIFYDGNHGWKNPTRVWRCSSREGHVVAKHDELLTIFAARLVDAIRQIIAQPAQPEVSPDQIDLEDLRSQRKRLEDAYQAGVLSLANLTERVAGIDEIIRTQADREYLESIEHQGRNARQAMIQQLADEIDAIPTFLTGADPNQVNHILRMLVEKIVILGPQDINIIFR